MLTLVTIRLSFTSETAKVKLNGERRLLTCDKQIISGDTMMKQQKVVSPKIMMIVGTGCVILLILAPITTCSQPISRSSHDQLKPSSSTPSKTLSNSASAVTHDLVGAESGGLGGLGAGLGGGAIKKVSYISIVTHSHPHD